MENASEALKMGAAVLIFVMAISISIFAFTKVRQASTAIMDKFDDKSYYSDDNVAIQTNRIVGIETIIPTLYSYYDSNTTILFYVGEGFDENTYSFTSIKEMPLYYSEALGSDVLSKNYLKNDLDKSLLNISNDPNDDNYRAIYGLDIHDELTRREPWSYNEVYSKIFVESLIAGYNGTEIDGRPEYASSRNISRWNYSQKNNGSPVYYINFQYKGSMNGKSLSQASGARFLERVGQYNTDLVSTVEDGQEKLESQTTGSVIKFSNDGELIDDSANQKKVIKFIYIKK